MKHLGTNTLENGKLLLRRFTIDDAQAMYDNWASDPEVNKFLTWPLHTSVEVTKEILNGWISQYDDVEFYNWAIVLKDNGDTPIGGISVVAKDNDIEMIQIGYCIGKSWWGRGIVTEALELLVSYFFNEVKVNRVEAVYDLKNPASGKVMEKCGFIHEGVMRDAGRNNQGICDLAMNAVLAKDYVGTKYFYPND